MCSIDSGENVLMEDDDAGISNKILQPTKRKKLATYFQHITSNASLDFTSPEIRDIQDAVHTLLERIKTRVNNRGVFNITSIVPTGSMAEGTAIWRFDEDEEENYLEFDYLAVLKGSIRQCKDQIRRNDCKGCVRIINPQVSFRKVKKSELYLIRDRWNEINDREPKFHAETLKEKSLINDTFMNEIHNSITSLCDCLLIKREHPDQHLFQPTSIDKIRGCDICTVTKTTGTLRVITGKAVEQFSNGLSKCSLILRWTSKTKSLFAPDKLLEQKHAISSLPIYIDFLPAMESLKLSESCDGYDHDYFVVPKTCNVQLCSGPDNEYKWRKSWCMAEIQAFKTEMSDKHRRCYQITKYLTKDSLLFHINKYLIKNVVLQHHTTCSDTEYDCVDCVIEVYQEILNAYKRKEFLSFHSNIIIRSSIGGIIDGKDYYCEFLRKLHSVSETDTFDRFVSRLL